MHPHGSAAFPALTLCHRASPVVPINCPGWYTRESQVTQEAVPVMLQEGVMFVRSVDASSTSELGNGRSEAALMLKCRTDRTDIPTRILQTARLLGQNLQKLILSVFQEKASDVQNLSAFFLETSCLPIRSPS